MLVSFARNRRRASLYLLCADRSSFFSEGEREEGEERRKVCTDQKAKGED